MNLLLISSIVLAINIVMLYSYHQKSFFIKIHSDFHKEEKMGIISKTDTLATPQQLFGFSNKETFKLVALIYMIGIKKSFSRWAQLSLLRPR